MAARSQLRVEGDRDSLLDYARESTENAQARARYPETAGGTMKAVLHTWLA